MDVAAVTHFVVCPTPISFDTCHSDPMEVVHYSNDHWREGK